MDSKNTIEAALGMLTTIAFTVPGGQPLAAGLAVADFFVKLFFPDTPPPPPPPAVTPAQLHQELNDLLAKIVDALWKDSADTITTNVLARNTVLQATWDSMTTLGVNGQSFAMDGIDNATRNTITGNNTYFQWNVNPLYTDLLGYQGHFNTASLNAGIMDPLARAELRTAHTAAYCLIGSLLVAYFKMAVAWGWGWDMLLNAQYQAYQAAVDDWNNRPPAYQAKNPYPALISSLNARYEYLKNFATYQCEDWNGYVGHAGGGVVVSQLKLQVDNLLQYCVEGDAHPLYTTMRNDWDALETLVTGYDVTPASSTGVTQAEMTKALAQGVQRAFEWRATVEKTALVGVSEDDIDRFGRCIASWRAASASVRFKTYVVVTGDTLTSLAKTEYGDATMTNAIFDNNRDQLTDPNVLSVGMVLKIYEKAWLADLGSKFDPSKVGN